MKALAISICVHGAILWILSLQAFNDYGISNGANSRMPPSRPIIVTIIAGESATQQLQSRASEKAVPVSPLELHPNTVETNTSSDGNPEDKSNIQYLPSGQLTRAPVPLEAIDLNATSIDEVAVVGRIELTILLDETGSVVEVSIPDDPNSRSIFANRVTARFKKARFAPGEINGVPVKSRLQITVVSEPQLEPARN